MMHDRELRAKKLRRAAEDEAAARWSADCGTVSLEDAQRLLHELRVHQIELEMQNEELRRTQLDLDTSRARYFDLYELAPVGYLTLNQDGVILEANLRASTLLGVPRAALVRQRLTDFVEASHQDLYYLHSKRAVDADGPCVCELLMKRPSGELFWVRLAETVVRADPGGTLTRNVTLSDLSQERALSARLAQADRLASMSILAAGVSHELNNPLTYVLFNLDSVAAELPMLVKDLESCARGSAPLTAGGGAPSSACAPHLAALADQLAQIEEAAAGAHRIQEITRGLGLFSRVEREKVVSADLNESLRSVLRLAANQVKNVATLVEELGVVPPILAPEGKLAQVALNLLLNAVQAITTGSVETNRITVRSWAEGERACFEIADTGCGIPSENLELVFEPFFTTKGPERGTGLGLAIARSLVREFGGDLRLQSTQGKGTSIKVWFPFAAQTLSPAPESVAAATRGRILVVDDEKWVAVATQRLLSSAHDVVIVTSAAEAQALLSADAGFDLILCDLMMTPMSGIELHAWLELNRPSLSRKLVFITGGVFTPRVLDYLEESRVLCIEKPFDRADLLRQVALCLAAPENCRV